MIDAAKGFMKDGAKNRLRAQDIHKIVDTFNRQTEIPKYSRMVPLAEIETKDFNLNLPRYIDSSSPADLQDIEAHLKGGIPDRDINALDAYWHAFPGVRAELFSPLPPGEGPGVREHGYSRLKIDPGAIKAAILDHPEFTAFTAQVTAPFADWRQANLPHLTGIRVGDRPKLLIETLSEGLLETFRRPLGEREPLIDPYDLYQHLLDYWDETLQDDAWMLVTDGWTALQDGRPNRDLIPPALLVARYFASEQAAVERLEAERDAVARELEELE